MWSLKSCWEVVASLLLSNAGRPQYPLPLGQQPLTDPSVHHSHAPSTFKCHYPPGWESCNTPDDRGCWLKKKGAHQPLWNTYDINTRYEDVRPPPGVKREYWIGIEDTQDLHPDGYRKNNGKAINGTYPGPLIEACWGDDIIVHVTNRMRDNGTTIHWHGVRQLHSNEMDGVNAVTQCPIVDGETFTYRFKAEQYGHSWYHSHYSIQYGDGVAGPLLIHGPTSADYDEEFAPIIMTDWVHETASLVFSEFELEGKAPVPADSILLDGHGNFTCDKSDARCTGQSSRLMKTFEKGRRYLIRLVNGSVGSSFIFSIDGHNFTVVSTDFVPIQPYNTSHITVSIGQRYGIIVEANPDTPTADGNYWIRTEVPSNNSGACGKVNAPGNDERRGIIRYNPGSTADPSSVKHDYPTDISSCMDEDPNKLVPVVPWFVDPPVNNVTENTYEVGTEKAVIHGFAGRWDLTDHPMWLNFSDPTILNLRHRHFDPDWAVVDYNFDVGYAYLVVTTNLARLGHGDNKTEIPAGHPIHLHGHDFVILGQSNQTYNESSDPQTFKTNNPTRRDVALLPGGGWLAIAFKPDNPGIWLLHCHIAWHASNGLALQIMENQEEILEHIGTLTATQSGCQSWDQRKPDFVRDDSGI